MERPILFNTEMVRAILEGRKTQTRRIIKDSWLQEIDWDKINTSMNTPPFKKDDKWYYEVQCAVDDTDYIKLKPSCLSGDILYVRETFTIYQTGNYVRRLDGRAFAEISDGIYAYKADGYEDIEDLRSHIKAMSDCSLEEVFIDGDRWKPSIHMPKKAARLFLKVTDVRAERLQDIKTSEIEKEGTNLEGLNTGEEFRYAFQQLWTSTMTKETYEQYGWDANPWVWVIEFERING